MPASSPEPTFWFRANGGGFYLIPDGVELPEGELDLRTLSGQQRLVEPSVATEYSIDKAVAHAHLKGQLLSGLGRARRGLEEAWARGRPAATSPPTPPSPEDLVEAAERAEAGAVAVAEAAAVVVRGLQRLGADIREAADADEE